MTQATKAIKKIDTLFLNKESVKVNKFNRVVLWFLLFVLFSGSISYAYFVNGTILNLIARKNVENKILELSSEISVLESKYILENEKINIEYANSVGYNLIHDIKYLSLVEESDNITINVTKE